jgi:hypothetical protein
VVHVVTSLSLCVSTDEIHDRHVSRAAQDKNKNWIIDLAYCRMTDAAGLGWRDATRAETAKIFCKNPIMILQKSDY